MAGLDNSGLTIKRLEDVVTDLSTNAVNLFQDLVTNGDAVDTSAGTAIGRIIGVSAPGYSDLWEAIQQIYSAFDPNSAQGIALDNLVSLSGISRFDASPSTGYLLCTGDSSTVIPDGSIVSSLLTGKQYETNASLTLNLTSAATLELTLSSVSNSTLYRVTCTSSNVTKVISYTSDGSATTSEILTGLKAAFDTDASSYFTTTIDVDSILITCNNLLNPFTFSLTGPLQTYKVGKVVACSGIEDGPITQDIGTISTILTPVLGWDTVTNPYALSLGSLLETDEELRLRFRNSKFTIGSNIADALYSDLLGLEGVDKVIVLVNDTGSTDANGLVAHSFMAIVNGGIDEEIGQVIWNNKPTGIVSNGDTDVDVLDVQSVTQTVSFQRPTPTRIYMDISVTATGVFPTDGPESIKAALVQYFRDNFSIGDDIIYSRLYTPVNSVAGHQVNHLYVGTSSSPTGVVNVAIAYDHIATLEIGDITVTVV